MRHALAVVVSAAVLAGCSNTQDSGGSNSKTDSTSATSPANSAPDDTQRGLRVGDPMPRVMLAHSDGSPASLEELAGDGSLVVIFYRGGWCPYCTGSLAAWQGRLDEVKALGATLVAVTPEKPSRLDATTSKHNLEFPILSDAQGQAARAFDLGFTLDPQTQNRYRGFGIDLASVNAAENWDLVIPATYIIDREGIIRYAYVNEDYRDRAEVDDVLEMLSRVQ